MTDLAIRAYNHSFRIDPCVRSLLDTDFYKLLMAQFIWKNYRGVQVTFALKNRTKNVLLGNIIPEEELRAQLDHARTLRFKNNELIWLAGNTFYGQRGMFEPEFIEFLRNYQLPEYSLKKTDDGQYEFETTSDWVESTFWEIHALEIINTLRNRAGLQTLSKFELDILYSRAKNKLWEKLQILSKLPGLNLTDFGTRRRHDFLFQEWAILAAADVLGSSFTGTSNALIAMNHSLDAKGTNAHEQPTTLTALTAIDGSDKDIRNAQYKICEQWEKMYGGNLLVALPDTFGTTQFLRNAPDFLDDWKGLRFDSKKPIIAGEEAYNWWVHRGQDPSKKLGIWADGLDVKPIVDIYNHFYGRMSIGFGWGTLMSNDFRECHPRGNEEMFKPISLVCKVKEVNGHPAVKLSDNMCKAMGDPDEVARYYRIFGTVGMENNAIVV